jgi:hypothetical protein
MSKIMNRDIVFKGLVSFLMRRITVTGASNAASARGRRVQITTEALTTAAGATYTETLTNAEIKADSMVIATVKYGTSTTGTPVVTRITPANGSVVVILQNIHASAALNGTIVIDIMVIPNSPTP